MWDILNVSGSPWSCQSSSKLKILFQIFRQTYIWGTCNGLNFAVCVGGGVVNFVNIQKRFIQNLEVVCKTTVEERRHMAVNQLRAKGYHCLLGSYPWWTLGFYFLIIRTMVSVFLSSWESSENLSIVTRMIINYKVLITQVKILSFGN